MSEFLLSVWKKILLHFDAVMYIIWYSGMCVTSVHMPCIFICMYMSSLSFFKGPHHIARCTSVVALALEMYVCR